MRTVADQQDGRAGFSAEGIDVRAREELNMKWQERLEDSKGMLLVLCSELFGTGMVGDGRWGMMTLQVSRPRPVPYDCSLTVRFGGS
jgi:hypothetical protein